MTRTPPLPVGKFAVIYADPPWAWGKAPLVDRGAARAVEKEYPTMQPDELERLPVGNLAAADCALFLWTTGPKLKVGLTVLSAWGFDYKTIGFVWAKQNRKSEGFFMGMGFYTRANAELCLIGTRGSPKRLDAGVSQLVVAPVGEHSAKPREVRKRIERLFAGPRIELFAREHAEGWQSWGLEVNERLDAPPQLWPA